MLGIEPESWAYRAITIRFAIYIQQILKENHFSDEIVNKLLALEAEIPEAPIRFLHDPGAPDEADWNRFIEPYAGMNWLQPPWFFSEHYFYRRIMEAIGYFQKGEGKNSDPFAQSKQRGLEFGISSIEEMATQLYGWMGGGFPQRDILLSLIHQDLWGNQADYSLWPADAGSGGGGKPDHAEPSQANDFLLVDDSFHVADHLLKLDVNNSRIDFLIDNAGMELASDLVLVDFLLSSGVTAQVRFHLKTHPTFVSDALPKDVLETISFFHSSDASSVISLGERLETLLCDNRLLLRSDFFWNSPLAGWEMSTEVSEQLSESNLVISKGDANYRRLLGDRHWPFTTPFADIVSYFPAPLVALRTLKSELASGLTPGKAEILFSEDPDWLVNGRWGIIQFFSP